MFCIMQSLGSNSRKTAHSALQFWSDQCTTRARLPKLNLVDQPGYSSMHDTLIKGAHHIGSKASLAHCSLTLDDIVKFSTCLLGSKDPDHAMHMSIGLTQEACCARSSDVLPMEIAHLSLRSINSIGK